MLKVVSDVKRLDRHNSHVTPEAFKPKLAPKVFILYVYVLRFFCVFLSYTNKIHAFLSPFGDIFII